MRLFKDKKIFLNLLLCIVSTLPFFVLLGSFVQFDVHNVAYINFYSFLQKSSSFAANFIFLFIIMVNFGLLLFNFIYSLVKQPKSLQNLIIFAISAALSVGMITFSFLLGQINGVQEFVTIVPILVAMLGFLSIVLILIRLVLETKIEEK